MFVGASDMIIGPLLSAES